MYVAFGGKLDAGRTVASMDMIFPVTGDTVIVAGDTVRLSFSSGITAREDTRTVTGTPGSFGGVYAGVG